MLKRIAAIAVMGGVVAAAVAMTLGGTASAHNVSLAAAATSKIKCTKTVTIGVAYPEGGNAAPQGALQWAWAQWAQKIWNKSDKPKIALLQGDTELASPNADAAQVAQAFASNAAIGAVTGPAGSQEVEESDGVYEAGGLAAVSGSATRIQLTRANAGVSRETPNGYFFRTVPNDGQQGQDDAYYIAKVLKKKNVEIIDDGEAYSTGLATQVAKDLKTYKVTVERQSTNQNSPNYSALVDSVTGSVQLVYIPWQLSSMAQTFFTDLRSASKSQIVFGSDGTDDPTTFVGVGSYVSGFPIDTSSSGVKAFMNAHSGDEDVFGVPTYTSVMVNARAIQMACHKHTTTTRAAVRAEIPKVTMTKAQSLLGFPVAFLKKNFGVFQGPGDMGGTAGFGIYKIYPDAVYKRVG